MPAKQHSGGVDFGLLIVRIVVGAYVAIAGLMKLGIWVAEKGTASDAATQAEQAAAPSISLKWPGFTGDGGMGAKIEGFVNNMFKPMEPDWLPDALGTTYAYVIPFAELVLGVLVIVGLFTRTLSTLLLLMVASFAWAVAEGNLVSLFTGGVPFHHNLLILAMLIMLMFGGPGRISIDRLVGGGDRPEPGEDEEEGELEGNANRPF